MTNTPPKPWYRSKTLWFNLAVTAAGSWTYFESAVGNLRGLMTPVHFGVLITVIGVIGALLRVATTAALTLKKPE